MTQLAFTLTAPEPRRQHGVRETSVEAHRHLREVGHLDRRERTVLDELGAYGIEYCHAPTSAELARWYGMRPRRYSEDRNRMVELLYVRRGLSDLCKKGVVVAGPKRRCSVSGRTCVTWKVR